MRARGFLIECVIDLGKARDISVGVVGVADGALAVEEVRQVDEGAGLLVQHIWIAAAAERERAVTRLREAGIELERGLENVVGEFVAIAQWRAVDGIDLL